MSYASIIKRLPKNLRSTTGLALLASLGAHALLLAIAPVFPSVDSKSVDAKSKPAVGLVELTPSEQNRLPPSATLPPFAAQLSELPPLPPASSFQRPTSLPLRSTQSYNVRTRSNTRVANNPRRNSLRQSQTKTSKVPPTSVPLRDSQPLQPRDSQSNTQQIPTKPQMTYGVNQNYRLRKLESLDSTLDRLSPSEVDEQQLQASNQEETTNPTTTSQNNNQQATNPATTLQNNNRQASTPSTNSRQATNPATTSQNNNQQATNPATTLQNNNRQATNPTTTSDSRLAALLAENRLRRTQYAYNPANTSTQDAVKNLESWLVNVKKDQNIEELKPSKPKTLNLDYPLKACVKQKPNPAGVVALVNSEGKITNVDITQSTGYDTLNTVAQNAVKAQSVPKPQNGYNVYQYRVRFNYDSKSCLSVVAPASG